MKKIDGFIVGLAVMIAIAWFFPQMGVYRGVGDLDQITTIGIGVIFFFYGLKLSPRQMVEGMSNYRLHALVQFTSYVFFPLLILAFKPLIVTLEQQMIWMAMFFLAVLPSTVSSSVVMVVMAKGNIPAAIFNASLSGIIGIVITPLWMSLFWVVDGESLDFSSVFIGLFFQIILPMTTGLIFHSYATSFVLKHNKFISNFDKTVILLIVYKSFSSSFTSGLFESISTRNIIIIFIAMIALFVVVYSSVWILTGLMHFNREDRITAVFCGSKKSLVQGAVFSKIIFKNAASQGLLLIPIMLYHSLQLVVISFIAKRMAKEVNAVK